MEAEEILRQVNEEFRMAARNPESHDFRERPPYKVAFTPEHPDMKTASVDLENSNVKVRYEGQGAMENYKCVKNDPVNGIGLVEGKKNHDHYGTKVNSRMHYLVTEDKAFRHTRDGYEQILLERPVEVANSFEELYRRALTEDNEEKAPDMSWGPQELDHVPPPEEDGMFTD